MLLRSIRPFAAHPRVGRIVVALPDAFAASPHEWLATVAGERLRITHGGVTRAGSVRAALAVLDSELATVLVHDAARPFVSPETVDAVIGLASEGNAVVPGVPVSETLKRVAGTERRVVATVDRGDLWRARTPQGFPRAMLEEAFRTARDGSWAHFTDEAALVESAGFAVLVVPDREGNVKITTEEDFAVAEYLATR
jgi:2-C-methyl-D-erythritol 4-phosphate cytidylyltransferase/2-C-methyl-D-erythritol 2,4-cyclodiphosphate synthase